MSRGLGHTTMLLVVLLLMAACGGQDICDDDSQAWLAVRFRTLNEGEIVDTILGYSFVWGIREGRPDSLLFGGLPANKILLPLDPNSTKSCYVFTDTINMDTLCIIHDMEAYLISENCGFAGRFSIRDLEWVGGMIRDAEIVDDNVDAEFEIDEENIWIYF